MVKYMDKFLKNYINNLKSLLDRINPKDIQKVINALEKTTKDHSKIYVIGNGGSSATASHIANDLGTGLRQRNIINFDITSLGDNSAITSAVANDMGYENIFYMQLQGILKPTDVLLAISCSGNSPNIIKAAKYAKETKSTLIGLTGFDGGELKKISDISLHVQTQKGKYGLVEDIHMIFDHILFTYYKEKNGK